MLRLLLLLVSWGAIRLLSKSQEDSEGHESATIRADQLDRIERNLQLVRLLHEPRGRAQVAFRSIAGVLFTVLLFLFGVYVQDGGRDEVLMAWIGNLLIALLCALVVYGLATFADWIEHRRRLKAWTREWICVSGLD